MNNIAVHIKVTKHCNQLSVQFSPSVCLTLCDSIDCDTPGFPVYPYLLESTQTHVHRIGDAIQPYHHPLSSNSALTFSLSQHQDLFQWDRFFASCDQNTGVSASASVLPMNIKGWFPLGWTCLIFLLSKGLSRVFSSTTVQKHQFFSAQPSLRSSSHIHTWLLGKPQLWL